MATMGRFEIEKFGLGWSVTNGDNFRIFGTKENAEIYARNQARGRRGVIVLLDADGSELSSTKINGRQTESAQ